MIFAIESQIEKNPMIELNVAGSNGEFYEYQIKDSNGVVLLRKEASQLLNGDVQGALAVIMASIATQPVTQATNVVFSDVLATSMTVSWTNGSGSSRIVVAHSGSAVDSDPVDFTTAYTANANFGDGSQIGTDNYVVYIGGGTSVPVTGLTTATTYHFRVYEFNGTGVGANYNTSTGSGNPASQATS